MKPKALILFAHGTNRDLDVAEALSLAGADPEVVPLNALRDGSKHWSDYRMLVLPGGFSYADALGAGKLLAIDLRTYFADHIREFVDFGKPVIGICNGFQTLVKAGVLPGSKDIPVRAATLTFNECGHFECRWVTLKPVSQVCLWTRGLSTPITCPVAHGEGNFQVSDAEVVRKLQAADQIALIYTHADDSPARRSYPTNPNGSVLDIAGVTNPGGNVLGLMPHPENHIHAWQHPRRTRGVTGGNGLVLFQNGVRLAGEM